MNTKGGNEETQTHSHLKVHIQTEITASHINNGETGEDEESLKENFDVAVPMNTGHGQ